ncbi:hypothetical protein C8F01DRAFT_1124433 [Mycena amicta]|nr:hypothetical protein C8F01DRAFT_1124433 [Mycena amicta]
MKLSASWGLIPDLCLAIYVATLPTLGAIFRQPSLLLSPASISRIFMAAVWTAFAGPTDEGARPTKIGLIKHARGTLLDIGAGLGHSIQYLDRANVTAYVALEPNTLMHDALRKRANSHGFREEDGTLLILRCGAEDTATIQANLAGAGLKVDTMLSIMTICSLPSPQETLAGLVNGILVPGGGQLLFYEHVLSPIADVAWWQRFWTRNPMWRLAFDGCHLDRPTHLWVDGMQDGEGQSVWAERELWGKEGEPSEHLFWHQVGRFVKR